MAAGIGRGNPLFVFSAAIRKIIYATNAVESPNTVLRKTLRKKISVPTKQTSTTLIFMAVRNFEKGGGGIREWVAARDQLAVIFGGLFNA